MNMTEIKNKRLQIAVAFLFMNYIFVIFFTKIIKIYYKTLYENYFP